MCDIEHISLFTAHRGQFWDAPSDVKLRYDLHLEWCFRKTVWLEPLHISGRQMTKGIHDYLNAQADQSHGSGSAELTELLGYLTTQWDDDQRALSRQLHDTLGSSLTALTMHLDRLGLQIAPDQALVERVAQMKTLLTTIIDTNRQMQTRLWNDQLEFLGLKVAIADLAAQFGEAHGITARVSLPDEDLTCPRLFNVALLRTLEQGLSNVAAHANATEVDVILDDNEHAVMLTVRDNGVGIDADAAAQRAKHGLRTLRQRAVYLHGTLTLAAHQDGGTILTMTLPKNPVPN